MAPSARRTAFRLHVALLAGAIGLAAAPAQSAVGAEPVLAWGDQGEGTYKNPVLPADYSDPDVIRVGDDFYLVASDFHFVGIQVLHSRDLVNWRVIGQVFDRLAMAPKYDEMQGYAEGTWAPSLRYHAGEFFLFVCTPKDGLFMWHSKDPAGPWSETVTVRAVGNWEDPCPFWDDDGQAYLVHSRTGAGPLILHKLSTDGTRLLDDGVEIYRGPVAEGPKLFKRHGWYYISLPENGVSNGGQTVLRAKSIFGPYERREVLPPGSPHQGGLIELANGEAWFIGFKSTGFLGRIAHLLPVTWGDDDWPVFGDRGQPVVQWKKPAVGRAHPIEHPQRSDEFGAPQLSPIWQWNHNPVAAGWSLTERPGWLRLKALPAEKPALARNTLTEKLWDHAGVIDVMLDARGFADGQRAGFAFICGKDFACVGVEQSGDTRHIFSDDGIGPDLAASEVWLRGTYDGETARLWFSLDGKTYVDTGVAVTLKFASWKGARCGIFCYGANGGAVDVDFVHYRCGSRLAELEPGAVVAPPVPPSGK